jgi:hypothetical protein
MELVCYLEEDSNNDASGTIIPIVRQPSSRVNETVTCESAVNNEAILFLLNV